MFHNNRSNIFPKTIKALITSSAVALLASNNYAFATAAPQGLLVEGNAKFSDTVTSNSWFEISNDGASTKINAAAGPTAATPMAITYGGDYTISANVPNCTIPAINVGATIPGNFTLHENLTIGSIITSGTGKVPFIFASNNILTLNGTAATKATHGFDAVVHDYSGLGDINFNSNQGTLAFINLSSNLTITQPIDNNNASEHYGTLAICTVYNGNYRQEININNAIGKTNRIKLLEISGSPRNGFNTNINSPVFAENFNITSATAWNDLPGDILNINANLHANIQYNLSVDFGPTIAINIQDKQSIYGSVNIASFQATSINFLGSGTIKGVIGDARAINNINFNGTGAVSLQSAAHAATFDVANAGAVVTASAGLKGNVTYSAAGKMNANGGIIGNVDFFNHAGTLDLADGKTITGTVDGAGTLGLGAGSSVTGAIGGTTPLAKIKFTGAGATTIPSASATIFDVANAGAVVTASAGLKGNVTYSAAGKMNANGGIIGNVDFFNHAGTLDLADGKTITGTVDGAGTLGLGAGSSVTGAIGGTTPLAKIKFTGAGATTIPFASATIFDVANAGAVVTASAGLKGNVTYSAAGKMNANGGIIGNVDFFNHAGTLDLADGKTITGTVDGAGTLGLGAGSSVTGAIGGTTPLAKIKFTGAGATTIPSASATIFDVANAGAVVTASAGLKGNVTYSAAGKMNANGGIIGNVDFFNHAGTLDLADGKTITGTVDGAGTLGLGAGSSVTGAIGGTTPLAKIKFTGAGATTIPSASATIFDVANAGAVVTASAGLKGNVTYSAAGKMNANGGIIGNVDFFNHAGTLDLADGKTITGSVTSTGGVNGTLNFAGDTNITSSIGTAVNCIKNISFYGNAKTVKINHNLYANTINAGNNNIVVTGDRVILSGTTKINGNIDLGVNRLVLQDNQDGNSSWGPNTSISTTLNSDNTLGTMDVKTPVDVESTLHVVIDDKAIIHPSDIKYLFINTNGGNLQTNFTVSGTDNSYFNWKIAIEHDKNVYLYRKKTSSDNLPEDVTINGGDNIDIENAYILAGSTNNNTLSLVHNIGMIDGKDRRGEAARRVSNNLDQLVTDVVKSNITQINNALIVRIAQVKLSKMHDTMLAVSAGDENIKATGCAWAIPYYGQSSQKANKGRVGYNAKSSGGILGLDVEVNDDLVVGAAFSIIDSQIKYKDYKSGDSTKADSKILSIYGGQYLTKELFVQAIASYSSTNVNTKEHRLVSRNINAHGYQIAKSNYDTTSFGGEILLGYNKKLTEQLLFTPIIGINYIQCKDYGYQEQGTTYQNKIIASKYYNRTEAKIGTQFATITNIENLNIIPEVHAFIFYQLRSRGGKIDARLNGMTQPFVARSYQSASTIYNIGLGLTASSGYFEYGATFDSYLGKKYKAHQGSIKLKVNL